MDPYIIADIISYMIDDVDESIIALLSNAQKSHLRRILENREECLLKAIRQGHIERVKLFFLPSTTCYINSYVKEAVRGKHHEIVRYLYDMHIKEIGKINFQSNMFRGDAPLLDAIWNKDIEMVKLLISYGANLDFHYSLDSGTKRTPLQFAIMRGLPVVKVLLEAGASVSYDNCLAMREATVLQWMEIFKEMIKYAPDSLLLQNHDWLTYYNWAKNMMYDEAKRRGLKT